MRRVAPLLVFLALTAGCSPVYVVKAGAGHAKLLWRRRSLESAIADPKTSPALRGKLALARDIRRFGFERMALKSSRDYSTYSRVDGPYLSYLVEGCEKARFKPYTWTFPIAGTFPYLGFFDEKDALKEKARLERLGYDATMGGAAAYNTPLWFSDPIPSPLLEEPPGELAATLLHELAHGTVYFKSQTPFDESAATFIGDKGAELFLAERFGPDSSELRDFRKSREDSRRFSTALEAVYRSLDALYQSSSTVEEKLARRDVLFRGGQERLKTEGFSLPVLNNAVILSHRLYHGDLGDFARALGSVGGDWPRFIALLRGLDRKAPAEDLKRKSESRT